MDLTVNDNINRMINDHGSRLTEVTDLSDPVLEPYARLSENELRHYFEPHGGLFVAESALVVERALDGGCEPVSLLVEHKQVTGGAAGLIARCKVPVYTAAPELLEQLTGYHLARGVLCLMRRPALPSVEELCAGRPGHKVSSKDGCCVGMRRVAVLEAVMNPTNLGAIFRSAAALGMEAVLLAPGCTDPLYTRSARVSMGTVFQIPWTKLGEDWIGQLKGLGFKLAAFALTDDTVSIRDPQLNAEERLAVVLGSEGPGLKPETIAASDYTIRIPMYHGVDSLNVAAASAVAFWQLGLHTEEQKE